LARNVLAKAISVTGCGVTVYHYPFKTVVRTQFSMPFLFLFGMRVVERSNRRDNGEGVDIERMTHPAVGAVGDQGMLTPGDERVGEECGTLFALG
jgi:hypothetical protein